MTTSKQEILASLAIIESYAPAYFGDMPIADDVARNIFASAMAALSASPAFAGADPSCRETSLLATLAHVLLEAAYLRHQLHGSSEESGVEASRLLLKLGAH